MSRGSMLWMLSTLALSPIRYQHTLVISWFTKQWPQELREFANDMAFVSKLAVQEIVASGSTDSLALSQRFEPLSETVRKPLKTLSDSNEENRSPRGSIAFPTTHDLRRHVLLPSQEIELWLHSFMKYFLSETSLKHTLICSKSEGSTSGSYSETVGW